MEQNTKQDAITAALREEIGDTGPSLQASQDTHGVATQAGDGPDDGKVWVRVKPRKVIKEDGVRYRYGNTFMVTVKRAQQLSADVVILPSEPRLVKKSTNLQKILVGSLATKR